MSTKINTPKLRHHHSMAEEKLLNQRQLKREKQLKDAVQYCIDRGCKGKWSLRLIGKVILFLIDIY